ncbi:DNA replication/repair protein RecF [Litorihabitans aurantiacus]|uniref:DNA replication and repair protein RecF n=1 Tax=Litorihabitans aurantiacus TaxID=1930061 RepID=A0AA37XGT0_9MICO|nr:DNA replication/repair protein RecF [Litorihabitans aurantiacus]GMA33091.1 DNA replication and repair protein RecF [Litorihabitans aurantiacus]
MHVSDLALTDFRSYPEVVLAIPPGITAFVGPNGQGKTNLVESIGYLGAFSSHRATSDAPLVRQGSERAVVRARVQRGERPTTVEVELNAGRANRARVDRAVVPRIRDAAGIVRSVVFAPEDLALVKGDPDVRRRFLDDLLVQLRPRLASVRSDYDRVLRQRTALLKSAGAVRGGRRAVAAAAQDESSGSAAGGGGARSAALRTLDVWDAQLAAAGAQLVAARVDLVRRLRPHLAAAYAQVSSAQGDLAVGYRASVTRVRPDDAPDARPTSGRVGRGGTGDLSPAEALAAESDLLEPDVVEARLLEAMSRLRPKELERGVSLVGPHRDDVDLTLGNLPVKGYASHGESWSVALALRLASFELLRGDEWGGGDPVLILDDVFAELDQRRRARLATLVAPAEQVLLTSAVAHDVPEELEGARFDVMGGEVTRVR